MLACVTLTSKDIYMALLPPFKMSFSSVYLAIEADTCRLTCALSGPHAHPLMLDEAQISNGNIGPNESPPQPTNTAADHPTTQPQSPSARHVSSARSFTALQLREAEMIDNLLDVCRYYGERGDMKSSLLVDRIGMVLTQAFLNRAKPDGPNTPFSLKGIVTEQELADLHATDSDE